METPAEQLKTAEKRPLNQRVTEFLTAFAEEKNKIIPKLSGPKKNIAMAQAANCYRLAASVAENNLAVLEILNGVKKYGTEYLLVLNKKKGEAQETEAKNPAKKIYEDLEKKNPERLEALLQKARFLNERGCLQDPNLENDPLRKIRIADGLRLSGEIFSSKFVRPVKELADLFVYSRQRRNLERLNDEYIAMAETLQDLQKTVPRPGA